MTGNVKNFIKYLEASSIRRLRDRELGLVLKTKKKFKIFHYIEFFDTCINH